jgi:hypothetical protein
MIQESAYDFKASVTADFTATWSIPSEDELSLFFNTLKEKGKARITLIAEIESELGQYGRHERLYGVFLKK